MSQAPASDSLRDKRLERLWRAIEDDTMPYIDLLPDHWGELCVTPEQASQWADNLIEGVLLAWSPDFPRGGHFKGTATCLSALHAADRHDDLLKLLELAPYKSWHDRQWGVRALVAQGKTAAALRFAEDPRGLNQPDSRISLACEEILLSGGQWREAFDRYALAANRHGTYQATFQALAAKYPQIEPKAILADLVAATPGEKGKWFAVAKSAGLLAEASELARISPCDPKTLARAARDFAESKPKFARSVGLAALQWIQRGHGYDLRLLHVADALSHTLEAARHHGTEAETVHTIKLQIDQHPDHTVVAFLRRGLDELMKR